MNYELNEITDIYDLSRGYIFVDGFVFKSLTEPANIYDAIVIRSPYHADCLTPRIAKSTRSLEEHIEYINRNKINKAVIIAESIDFILSCPTLEYLEIIPSDTVSAPFDYAPLYKLPDLKWLRFNSPPYHSDNSQARIDFSRLPNLDTLYLNSPDISDGLNALVKLKSLNVSEYNGDLSNLIFSKALEELDIINCKIKTLDGLSFAESLSALNLSYNRRLSDISELARVSKTLKVLSINACPKISNFSVLSELVELEHLELLGSNKIPDLSFLSKMKKLKTFTFSFDVLNGNLSYCLQLPYASCLRGRKHYNLKDSDLPHNC